MGAKISIIGAGSAVFSLRLIRDLCLTPGLDGSVVSLMDIDPERLQSIHGLCTRYIEESGSGIRPEATTNRRASLDGADFVINTALVGGHDRLRAGWEIAKEHGYRYGGSLHIMHDEPFWVNFHQLRFFEDVVRDMQEICPEAWYIKVANPVLAGITYLGQKYPDLRMVGLCHGFAAVYKIADVLGLDYQHLTFEIPGVNHNVWLTSLYNRGEDVFPMLDRWIEHDAQSFWETCGKSHDLGPQAIDLYRRFGVFPIGDTCTTGGGSWPWWYHDSDDTEARWNEDPAGWWERHFSRGSERVDQIEQVANDRSRPVTETFPPDLSHEVMTPMIDALWNDDPKTLIGNVLNTGEYVPGLPRNVAVEIPLHVSKRGLRGIQTAPLPPAVLAHILRDRVAPVSLELAAYDERSRERLVELVMTDPWTTSMDQATRLVDAILSMPGHESMRDHYT